MTAMAHGVSDQTRSLARSFNTFGADVQRRLHADANSFFSPLSIGAALLAMHGGARGATADEMAATLHLPSPDAVAGGLPGLVEALGPRSEAGNVWDEATNEWTSKDFEHFRLSLATALWVKDAFPLLADFTDALDEIFGSEFFSDPFVDPAAAAQRINGWVSERTEGRITDLLEPDHVSEDTRLVLTNAVYFKARWASEFGAHATRPRTFALLGGEEVEVETMSQENSYRHWKDTTLGARALRLPYELGVSMLVVLPDPKRQDAVAEALGPELLDTIDREASYTLVDVRLPKIEMRFDKELRSLLEPLGMPTAFDMMLADFSGITPHPSGLAISQVVHQAWVKVDEEGTEAAAATAVLAELGMAAMPEEPPQPIPFYVDRPFYFFIRDDVSGTVLFQGRVVDPR